MKLRDLIANGQMQYLFDGRKGSILDWSGKNLGAAAITGTPTWARTKRGFGAFCPNAGTNYLSPGNPAGLQLSSGTIFAVAARGESNAANFHGIITKLNAYGLYFSIGAEPKAFGVYDWTAGVLRASTFTEGPSGRIHMYAMTFQSGVANGTAFYVDGVAYGLATLTILNQASNLNVGWGIAAGQGLGGPVLLAGVASRILTPADIAECYDEFLSQGWILDVQHRRGVKAKQRDMSDADYNRQGIVLATDFKRLPGGLLRDLGPNGYNGTATGVPVVGEDGEGMKTDGATDGDNVGDVTQLNNVAAFTITGWWKPKPGNLANASTLWCKQTTLNSRLRLSVQGPANPAVLYAEIQNGANTRFLTNAAVLRADVWQFIAITYNGAGVADTDKSKLYLDEAQYTAVTYTGPLPATTANNVGVPLRINTFDATMFPFGGTVRDFKVWNNTLSDGKVHSEYLATGAQKLIWQAPGEDCPVSLAASYGVANPNALGGGWRIISGTWKNSEDSQGRRWRECVTAGVIAIPIPSSTSVGTHRFVVYKANNGGNLYVFFHAGQPLAYDDVAQYGYFLWIDANRRVRLAREPLGGGYANLTYTNVGYVQFSTQYTFVVNRRASDGRFTQYIQGGVYTQPTLISMAGGTGTNPSIAEATYFDPKWFVFQGGLGDKLLAHDPTVPGNPGHPRIWQGVLDPTKNGELP